MDKEIRAEIVSCFMRRHEDFAFAFWAAMGLAATIFLGSWLGLVFFILLEIALLTPPRHDLTFLVKITEAESPTLQSLTG